MTYYVIDASFPEVPLSDDYATQAEAQAHAEWVEAHGGGAFYATKERVPAGHAFRPDPVGVMVCRRCNEWWDHPNHTT